MRTQQRFFQRRKPNGIMRSIPRKPSRVSNGVKRLTYPSSTTQSICASGKRARISQMIGKLCNTSPNEDSFTSNILETYLDYSLKFGGLVPRKSGRIFCIEVRGNVSVQGPFNINCWIIPSQTNFA